ncbi:MAG: hypothetical protein JW797_08225 [Bradymonadales bacterium]|nr:hypothetical protein [Bradymonadales bacterium]
MSAATPTAESPAEHQRTHRIQKRFRQIARQLDPSLLRANAGGPLTSEDLMADLVDKTAGETFLDQYTAQGIYLALERYGLIGELQKAGLEQLAVWLDPKDPFLHHLCIYHGGRMTRDSLVAELRVHVTSRPAQYDFSAELGDRSTRFLVVDWLVLQNPTRSFTPQRPPLPGQLHPGLSVGHQVLELLVIMAERLEMAGILSVPMHYHNAYLFRHRSNFVSPEKEGRFLALVRDLAGYPLVQASWAAYLGCVLDSSGGVALQWEGGEQIISVDQRVASYFTSEEYLTRRDLEMASSHFVLDGAALVQALDRLMRR